MKTILSAALTLSLFVLGAPASAQENAIPVAPAQPSTDAPSVEAAPAPAPAPDANEDAEPAAATTAAPAAADAPLLASDSKQALTVEGAPLGNDNVYVHGIQRKQFTNIGRHELALYPFVAQVNAKFTRHIGLAASYSYHVFENLALQVTPIFNYMNEESAFNQELIDKGHQQAQAATALLLQYGGVAGMEITPIYGKFAFYEGVLGHFSFVLNAGAGVGSTRIQLQNANDSHDASFGSTGAKFLGQVGAGFRLFIGERAAIRLEVRDLVYTARVDKINGCTFDDLTALANGGAATTSGCEGASMSQDDKNLAKLLLKETSSDVLNNISFYTGFSFLF